MELKSNIDEALWYSLEKNYRNESYSNAILDCIHFLTDTIREKSGLEGDGAALVGQAFSVKNPKIMVTKMQTESEKNIQRGLEEILRGIYTCIRNPRSHDKFNDKKEEADAIIYFINYLLQVIGSSQNSFRNDEFLERVYDKNYVCTEEYSRLLVREIPKREKLNIAIEVVKGYKYGNLKCKKIFLRVLLKELNQNEIDELFTLVSNILRDNNDLEVMRHLLFIIPGELWINLDKIATLRTENILRECLKKAYYYYLANKCNNEGELLKTITFDHIKSFNVFEQWTEVIVYKLRYGDESGYRFVMKYFWEILCDMNHDKVYDVFDKYIRDVLKKNSTEVVEKIFDELKRYENHPWREIFKEEIALNVLNDL